VLPRFIAALFAGVALAACAGRSRAAERDRNVIRADEIAKIEVSTAYDIVARLRPEFLRTRGPITSTRDPQTNRSRVTYEQPTITVFVDGMESGPVEKTLYLIPASQVHEIRLYRAADAVTKYGSRHTGGVIEVTTAR
jgi:hypothetical protein